MRAQSRRMALCGVLCALAEVFLLLGGLILSVIAEELQSRRR